MVLVLPDVSVTTGPDWAQFLNEAFELVDSHDHTPGKGSQLTQAAIVINDDFNLNGYNLIGTKSVRFSPQGATLSGALDKGIVYRVNDDLYYNNSSGTPVQITSGGSLASVGSGIISAFSPGSYPYNITTANAQQVIVVDTSSARTLNLPAATNAMFCMIKDGSGSAQTNNISVVPNGTDTIDGSNSTFLLDYDRVSIGLVSDGVSKWHVV